MKQTGFIRCVLVRPILASFIGMLLFTVAVAQESSATEVQAVGAAFVESFDQQMEKVDGNIAAVNLLEQRIKVAEGVKRDLIQARINRYRIEALNSITSLAREMAAKRDAGFDVSVYQASLTPYLESLPEAIEVSAQLAGAEKKLPDPSANVIELAMFDEELFADATLYDDSSWALKRGIDAARELGLNTAPEEAYLAARVTELMANASVFMDRSTNDVANYEAANKALPDDPELKGKLQLARQRVTRIAGVMENNIPLLDFLELPSDEYKRQLVASTGMVSAEALDVEVVSGLLNDWGVSITEAIQSNGPAFLLQLFIFVLIVFVFFKLAKLVRALVEKAFKNSRVRASNLLQRMVLSISYNVVLVIGFLVALSQIGISMGPLLAGLGVAGFIVGFALQDSLSNFASGMLILLYRPYDVGDMVEVSGVFGTVEQMSLVNTTILTLDNQTLIVPNNKIWQDVIKNLTYQDIRRVDMIFGIAYDQDVQVAENVLKEVVAADERVLEDPELNVRVHELGDSSVNFIVRPWVKTNDYWDVYWDITKAVKQRFDAEGISIPFPQRDVHLFAGESATRNFVDNLAADSSHTHIIDNDAPSDESDG